MEDVNWSALGLQGGAGSVDVCCNVGANGVCTSNLQPGGFYRSGAQICPSHAPQS